MYKANDASHKHTYMYTNSFCSIYLGTVDSQTRCSVELLVTNVTLEVLSLLVVNEHLVIIKFSVAIPCL